jgi:hypothetical protein
LNKAISVPDLYIEETDAVTKANVQTAVSDIIKRFPKHQSTSRRPNSPNYNRDNLTDQIFNLHIDPSVCSFFDANLKCHGATLPK